MKLISPLEHFDAYYRAATAERADRTRGTTVHHSALAYGMMRPTVSNFRLQIEPTLVPRRVHVGSRLTRAPGH